MPGSQGSERNLFLLYRSAGFQQPWHFLLRSQVSKWALLATHDLGFLENLAPRPIGASCTLWWGGGPLDIVLSGSGSLVHGPLDGRCKARNWNTFLPLVHVLRFRTCPSVWSVLHTVGQRSLHLFTTYDGSPGPLSSSLFCSLVGVRTPH
ncbi:hypothetical protein KSP40_PGU000742 [Platanthera guangdongensis]|uniref:Uncharacterized protein n=1 Tax=Platanthera guangdongensis TaxID=2320717 RepID=A0ABR2ML32_9ASPA